MKILIFKKPSSVARFTLFFILFTFCAPSILSLTIPRSLFITQSETDGKWLPDGAKWILSSKETPSEDVWQNSGKKIAQNNIQKIDATVYFCGFIPFKKVDISVTDEIKLSPGGNLVGINLKTKGVLVAGTEEIETPSGKYSPAKLAGIRSGDIITEINGTPTSTTDDVVNLISDSKDTIFIKGERDKKEMSWKLESVTINEEKKVGLWIRDTVAGIGTVTFYSDTGFGALGHPISDIDTGECVASVGGSIFDADVIGVDKSEKGAPGALKGVFSGKKIGEISKNSPFGIYGTCNVPYYERVSIQSRSDTRAGDAKILCDIGNGREEFDAKIIRILPQGETTKGMVIEITDENLLKKCGGIVQGMSGSPILQNGRIVGAVTHVFVNDPTRGYGIFIENMLAEAEKIK